VAKSAKSPSNQLKEGRSTAGTACPSTGNPGSNLIIFLLFQEFPGLLFLFIVNVYWIGSRHRSANDSGMAGSWQEARECAVREGLPQVYHDCDDKVYGACQQGEQQGIFKGGVFIEHRCICMPAHLSCEELEVKEKKFLSENPGW
jgi:hypothetical protein